MRHETEQRLPENLPLESIYTSLKSYSDQLPDSEEFRLAREALDNGRLQNFPPNSIPTIRQYMCRGIASSMQAVEVLAMVADPEKRIHLLREFDEGIVPDQWIEQLVVQREVCDPRVETCVFPNDESPAVFGLQTLEVVKKRDMNTVLHKIHRGIDEHQAQGFRLHAEAVEQGHTFIITKFTEELRRNGLLPEETLNPQL